MDHSPAHWSLRAALLVVSAFALSAMVGCQGFSAGKPNAQGSQPVSSGDLAAAPASIVFGNVQVGTSQSQTDILNNSGSTSLTLSQATVSGAGFSITGLNLPVTLAAGQSTSVNIAFSPTSSGSATGTLSLTNDGSNSPLSITLSANAVAASTLTASPTSFNFGSVQLGMSQRLTETLNNAGSESVTITQASATGAGFSYTGLVLPLTLAPGQSSTFGVVFAPASAGPSNGLLSLTISGSATTFDMALSGSGVTPASLTATPASLTFSSVQTGKIQTQTVTVTNVGGSSAIISQDSVTGSGFSISGLSAPLTLIPGQTASLTVTFAPAAAGNDSGSVVIASNAADSSLSILLTGSAVGATQGKLSVSPATIALGSVTVGLTGTQTGKLTATGSSISVLSVSTGSSEFTISGLSFPLVIPAGQSATFTVTFAPQSSGLASVPVTFISDASNTPSAATLSGTGVAAPAYSVDLSWTASTSPDIAGYNVYRRTGTTGSFAKINNSLDAITSYDDSSVADGKTYYYETTAVNTSGEESAASAPVMAAIPAP
jgi:Abnormal spindle-like microcephaly-assoc'd, ASPM-SPD-2-Hydin